ncbi:putative Prenylated RAB acceptor 1.G2 [Hibiscus syriacus]|uniref:Prenylated RAB acceptor 1.G2 n=1 Tax=Hibiscus syriacus TaxID=106335 RepID=A0A6A2Y1N0_HIBSY|nr:putative Prenylated RAB acceptor 1.G2 [Hibiscus syriacus]
MLSIENPPPDPPCPCQVLEQLKSGGDEIERPPHKLPLPEVDLLNKPFLDNHHHQQQHQHQHHTSLPKFSIRDYVFTARGNDIKKNWPFSSKNLQLCLKHGLKDPLPPFELLESSNDAYSNHNLAVTCIDNSSCRSGGEHGNDLPSTTASVSQADIDSVLVNKQSDSALETDTTVEASAGVQAAGKPRKTENATRPSGKKCRLIVKFGAQSEPKSTEDIASSSTMLSESMASKVCPVCKTFSSSSNTTLNAHIDQCLSDESTPKWTVDSSHRIKPRKTRMMVDIYATAKPCTLEELDRRNGRLEISDEGKKQRASSINPRDTVDVGAVYFDDNGTKIRILSKSNDVPPVLKVGDDPGPSKAFKGSKFFSTKKKRRHPSKHHKHLKLAPQSRKLTSHKTCSSTMVGGLKGYHGVAETCQSDGPDVPKQVKSSDSRNFRERVCSKQVGLSRKPSNQARNQPSVCRRNVSLDLQVQRDQPHQGDPVAERNCVRRLKSSSEIAISSPEKCEKREKPVHEAPDMNEREHSFGRKRVRNSLCGARIRDKVKLRSHKQNENHLSKDHSHLGKDRLVKSLSSGGNCSSSLSKKMVDNDANSNPNTPVTSMAPISGRSFAFKRFRSSPKKNVSSSSSRSSVGKFGSNLVKNHLVTESLRFMEEIDEDVSWGPDSDQECDLMHDSSENQPGRKEITEEMPFGGSIILGSPSGEQRRKSISSREESMTLSIHSTRNFSSSDEMENTDSYARSAENTLDKAGGLESFEDTDTSLSHSEETKFNKHGNLSENRSNSIQTHEDYSGHLCGGEGVANLTDPGLVGEPHMFCAELSHDIIGQKGNMGRELDSDAAQLNSFPEVDPIPIPGPPGSFLPSPRAMGSDDFQGNSSLTTSRIRSSQDQLDLVDGESSDSPISAMSTISNSLEAKSDSKLAEPLAFVGNPAMLENYRFGCSSAKSGPLVENGAAFPHTSAGLERISKGEKFREHRTSIENRPLIFNNDDQPCWCQRKERSYQGFALNYQESQLLSRRATTSMMVPTMGMQICANQNISPDNMDARPETNSRKSSAILGSEQVVVPVLKPPAGSIAFEGIPGAVVKLSDRSNIDPATPSSNPVLRLMGKNLMVVNKEEDTSVPLGEIAFHQTMPQSSSIFDQHPKDLAGDYNLPALPSRLKNKPGPDMEKVTNLDYLHRNGDSAAVSKEVIVTDDAPESETNKFSDTAKRFKGLRESSLIPAGLSMPLVPNHSVRRMNTFSRYQLEGSLRGDPSMVQNNNFNTIPSGRADAVPFRWDCTSERSGVPQRGPLMAASSSSGHLRPAAYYSPSLS